MSTNIGMCYGTSQRVQFSPTLPHIFDILTTWQKSLGKRSIFKAYWKCGAVCGPLVVAAQCSNFGVEHWCEEGFHVRKMIEENPGGDSQRWPNTQENDGKYVDDYFHRCCHGFAFTTSPDVFWHQPTCQKHIGYESQIVHRLIFKVLTSVSLSHKDVERTEISLNSSVRSFSSDFSRELKSFWLQILISGQVSPRILIRHQSIFFHQDLKTRTLAQSIAVVMWCVYCVADGSGVGSRRRLVFRAVLVQFSSSELFGV